MTSKDDLDTLYDAISLLAHQPFSENLLDLVCNKVCRVLKADYFGFYVDGPRDIRFSTSPPGYLPHYLAIADQDYLKRGMFNGGGHYVLSRNLEHMTLPQNRTFSYECQRLRPIGDTVYSAIQYRSVYRGFWSIARAGVQSPHYTDAEVAMIQFVLRFFNEAYERALRPPAATSEIAYLNARAEVLEAGEEIKESLGLVKQDGLWEYLANEIFDHLYGPVRVGKGEIVIPTKQGEVSLQVHTLQPENLNPWHRDIPAVSLTLLKPEPPVFSELGFVNVQTRYHLTQREIEVVFGLLSGKSNKLIAADLQVEEATIKRHLYNVYEKTGYSSRMELVTSISKQLGRSQLRQSTYN